MSTISLSVLLNGISYRHMKPIKGIRQGDILSPCFFIHSSKGLIKMFKFDERNEYIKGVCAKKMPLSFIIICLPMTSYVLQGTSC